MTAPPLTAAVIVGTRASALARAQTERVVALLEAAWPELSCKARSIVTQGDRTQASGQPLPEIGGKGLFTAELERALLAFEIDLAVHSLKDLPTEPADGVVVGAVCLREDVRDCLVARNGLALHDLPSGAAVGTSSLRRAAQLRGMRHDLEVRSVRGNVDTRIRKAQEGEVDGVVLAAAGIRRLGLDDAVTEWFSPEEMLPAPGQGALAVQCRAGDERMLVLLAAIDDPGTRAETTAERTFLSALGAGCTAPVGAYAIAVEDAAAAALNASNSLLQTRSSAESLQDEASRRPSNSLLQTRSHVHLEALVASVDGRDLVRVEGEGEPEEVGERLAREALAAGAHEILEAIRG